ANDLTATVVELRRTNAELEQSYRDTILRLVTAAEYKDQDTGAHIARIAHYSALMAQAYGLRHPLVVFIEHASPMHDVGKIGIPDHVLTKPGKLSAEEYELMKTHTTIGSRILSGSTAPVLRMAEEIARCHHERWDGGGYPQGLSGTEIPIAARIVNLVDTFDALTSVRPYKSAVPVEVAVGIIRKESGRQFDPELTELFLSRLDDIVAIMRREGSGA
ncbi:MAG: HD domain-containing protein, partial [Chitinivibrionales bacterium]|nr:HD domain-containing protein [Chitinivibrionales bacterium]